MTAALSDAYPPPGGWTTDDLDAMPDDGRRRDPVDEVYAETGRWTTSVDTGEPWPVNLPISRLTPRHL